MKHAVALLLALLICQPFSALANWNVQDLSEEELIDYRRAITEELASRHKAEIDTSEETRLIDIIPDEGFASLVRDSLGLFSVNDPVTQEQLDQVERINNANKEPAISSLDGIGRLRNLEYLMIYYKTLDELPEEIGTLTQLENLYVVSCGLTSIPDSICDLGNLKELSIAGNDVAELPSEIGSLQSLTKLDISNTQITSLPKSIYALRLDSFRREGLNIEE
ncbi:MAG: leucine-rich repeat domain-containing protein [Oscillospiraceae bacterium]|nr:leucine-rich repeat domain-containing protein [Oscillospiraceae bacterium]